MKFETYKEETEWIDLNKGLKEQEIYEKTNTVKEFSIPESTIDKVLGFKKRLSNSIKRFFTKKNNKNFSKSFYIKGDKMPPQKLVDHGPDIRKHYKVKTLGEIIIDEINNAKKPGDLLDNKPRN